MEKLLSSFRLHKKFWIGMISGIALILMLPLVIYSVNAFYMYIDQTRFPELPKLVTEASKAWKENKSPGTECTLMGRSVYAELQREIDSTFGWSVSDPFFLPTAWLDNRANRQLGVLYATRMIFGQFATNFAKYGDSDKEDPLLKSAREVYFNQGATVWGFWRPSAKSDYKKGIATFEKYIENVKLGKSTYNVRTDDVYHMIIFIAGKQVLNGVMGTLVDNDIPFREADDRCYYAIGVMLVVRDVVHAMDTLYPIIREKGAGKNLDMAYEAMDRICTFDPIIVLSSTGDSIFANHPSKLAGDWYIVINRLTEVAESINRG
jgi:hypothetical protein